MPPRAPGPHPYLEPGTPATDPAPSTRPTTTGIGLIGRWGAAAPLKPLPEPADLDQYRVRRQARVGGLINEYRLVA